MTPWEISEAHEVLTLERIEMIKDVQAHLAEEESNNN